MREGRGGRVGEKIQERKEGGETEEIKKEGGKGEGGRDENKMKEGSEGRQRDDGGTDLNSIVSRGKMYPL